MLKTKLRYYTALQLITSDLKLDIFVNNRGVLTAEFYIPFTIKSSTARHHSRKAFHIHDLSSSYIRS